MLSSAWGHRHREAAFVARRLAGGLSRFADVDVYVPEPSGPPRPDGAFDLRPLGCSSDIDDPWPAPSRATTPTSPPYDLVVVDRLTPHARGLVEGASAVAALSGAGDDFPGPPATALLDAGAPGPAGSGKPGILIQAVGCHVAVNPLSAARRHAGIGFTDYVLVLTDRDHGHADNRPPTLAQWLIARFTRRVVVVIEDAFAAVWRSRSLLGRITVDTRADLWRLMAQAAVTVDLRPGPFVARECVESLRYGVPIVVPAQSTGHRLARAGGGLWFSDVAELFACLEAVAEPDIRTALSQQGRAMSDAWYGEPSAFVERLQQAVNAIRAHADAPKETSVGSLTSSSPHRPRD